MLRGHERLRESPGPADERSTPEDVILTIEAALNSLPRVEANASPTSLVVVPAVSDDGVQLGQFVIDWDGESYIITEYSIDHVAGEPCTAS